MSNLTTYDPRSLKIGDTIKFSVKDYTDNVVYSGRIVSICDYQAARSYDDVVSRHQSMKSADATLGNVETFRFYIVECHDGVRRPFGYCPSGPVVESGGFSWFANDRVELIMPGNEYTVTLFNTTSDDAAMAVRILREHGFACRLNTVTL